MLIFVFNQKTAYVMRISDWISYVCSSDLRVGTVAKPPITPHTPLNFSRLTAKYLICFVSSRDVTLQTWCWRRQSSGHHPPLPSHLRLAVRSDERRVGTEGVSQCRYRWPTNQ